MVVDGEASFFRTSEGQGGGVVHDASAVQQKLLRTPEPGTQPVVLPLERAHAALQVVHAGGLAVPRGGGGEAVADLALDALWVMEGKMGKGGGEGRVVGKAG